jgi:FecR protein
MKNLSPRSVLYSICLLVLAGLADTVLAQYLVSTKAGFVNKVDGPVEIQRKDNEDGSRGRVSLGTQMKEGDLVITGAGGRAEILLNPGSYLRLNSKTEVRAVNTMLTETRFEVVSGSVIVEVGEIDKKTPIEIVTPNGMISINKSSTLLRLDVEEGVTVVAVRQGEAYRGTSQELLAKAAPKIGRGKLARLEGSTADSTPNGLSELAKLDKDEIDAFDTWSFNRAQSLMAANYSSLQRNSMRSSLAYGWFYDPFYNFYTFIPRGGYYSPYGFPFCRRFADFYYYYPYGLPYYYYSPNPQGGGGGGGMRGGNTTARVIAGIERAPIQRSMEGRRMGDASSGPDFGRGGGTTPSSSGGGTVSAPSSSVTVTGGAPSRGAEGGGGGGARPGRP